MATLLSYHAYGTSFLHRLDPRVKALWVVAGLFYIFSTADWRLLLLVGVVNILLAVVARISLRVLLPMLIALCLFGVVILVFQLLFQTGPAFAALGPIRLHTQGIYITREAWLRLADLALLFVGYMLWTHPTDIALMWVSFGLPYRYAMLLGLALRFFPVLQGEAGRISQSQQVRGQPLRGVVPRIRGLLTLVLPFVLRVLRRTGEVAISMELRGFGYSPSRTYLRRIGMRAQDWLAALLILLLIGLRTAGLFGWL